MSNREDSIGEAVRSRRTMLRLSQRDLARTAGTTAAAISHIERGIRKPSAGLLGRMASALGCSADDLLRGAMRRPENDIHVEQVVAAMRSLTPALQKEVLDFCGYLRHKKDTGGG